MTMLLQAVSEVSGERGLACSTLGGGEGDDSWHHVPLLLATYVTIRLCVKMSMCISKYLHYYLMRPSKAESFMSKHAL